MCHHGEWNAEQMQDEEWNASKMHRCQKISKQEKNGTQSKQAREEWNAEQKHRCQKKNLGLLPCA